MICARFYSLLHGGDGVIPTSGADLYESASAYLKKQGISSYFVTAADCPRWQFVRLLTSIVPEEDLTPSTPSPYCPMRRMEQSCGFIRPVSSWARMTMEPSTAIRR